MCPDELSQQVKQLEIYRVDYRPIIRSYIQRMGLVDLINSLIPTEMEVSPGLNRGRDDSRPLLGTVPPFTDWRSFLQRRTPSFYSAPALSQAPFGITM